ncbi:NADPH-flavin oxidoreductase [Marinomonas aquimarina]|uniref:NADPH-flavin oxidoreductase n=1 Tax=Marinomonas aquimarina TaxID=295068 RepID=A0A1A8T6Q1_9GAMM|nr:oxygen-insensitive NADPH nitroreductase [Marinomonas aquimarina]SBS28146.1 NADPH-flavin oxidoreductase [Marinomonas aquimarina]
MNAVLEQLQSHRSIRKFTDQPLPQGLLEKLVAAAQGASSSNHVQAYSIIRISDRRNRALLKSLAGEQAYIEQAAEFLVFCADMKRNTEAAARTGIEPTMGMTEQLLVATIDTALVAQNLAIAAESEGLGIVYIGGVRNNPEAICELLKLPQNVYPVFGMCLGYPAHNPEVKPRLPLVTVLKQDYYDDQHDPVLIDQYDTEMERYYQARTGGNKTSNWSQSMAPMFSGKLRPHMREFLLKQGFELK